MSYVVRYLHFISILLVYAAVFAEFIMLSRTLSRKKLSFLAKIDGVYGIASIFVVGAGMAMWFGFDVGLGFKPTVWYMENPLFHLKYVNRNENEFDSKYSVLYNESNIFPTLHSL